MWLLSIKDCFPLGVCNWGRLNILGVQRIQSPRLGGFSSCSLPNARKCSKFPISHRALTAMPCQMHFLTPLSISCMLPANTAVKCDHKIFIHPLRQGRVAAKKAVDTELEILSLDYPFLSDLFQISIGQTSGSNEWCMLLTAWLPYPGSM